MAVNITKRGNNSYSMAYLANGSDLLNSNLLQNIRSILVRTGAWRLETATDIETELSVPQYSGYMLPYFHSVSIPSTPTAVLTVAGGYVNAELTASANLPVANTVSKLKTGDTFAVCIKTDGTLFAWGKMRTSYMANPYAPSTPGRTWVDIDAGSGYFIALDSTGKLEHFGSPLYDVKYGMPTDANYKQVACGHSFAMALTNDGQIKVWGTDAYGIISQAPTGTFVKIACSPFAAVAVRANGTIAVWGRTYGSLPDLSVVTDAKDAVIWDNCSSTRFEACVFVQRANDTCVTYGSYMSSAPAVSGVVAEIREVTGYGIRVTNGTNERLVRQNSPTFTGQNVVVQNTKGRIRDGSGNLVVADVQTMTGWNGGTYTDSPLMVFSAPCAYGTARKYLELSHGSNNGTPLPFLNMRARTAEGMDRDTGTLVNPVASYHTMSVLNYTATAPTDRVLEISADPNGRWLSFVPTRNSVAGTAGLTTGAFGVFDIECALDVEDYQAVGVNTPYFCFLDYDVALGTRVADEGSMTPQNDFGLQRHYKPNGGKLTRTMGGLVGTNAIRSLDIAMYGACAVHTPEVVQQMASCTWSNQSGWNTNGNNLNSNTIRNPWASIPWNTTGYAATAIPYQDPYAVLYDGPYTHVMGRLYGLKVLPFLVGADADTLDINCASDGLSEPTAALLTHEIRKLSVPLNVVAGSQLTICLPQ